MKLQLYPILVWILTTSTTLTFTQTINDNAIPRLTVLNLRMNNETSSLESLVSDALDALSRNEGYEMNDTNRDEETENVKALGIILDGDLMSIDSEIQSIRRLFLNSGHSIQPIFIAASESVKELANSLSAIEATATFNKQLILESEQVFQNMLETSQIDIVAFKSGNTYPNWSSEKTWRISGPMRREDNQVILEKGDGMNRLQLRFVNNIETLLENAPWLSPIESFLNVMPWINNYSNNSNESVNQDNQRMNTKDVMYRIVHKWNRLRDQIIKESFVLVKNINFTFPIPKNISVLLIEPEEPQGNNNNINLGGDNTSYSLLGHLQRLATKHHGMVRKIKPMENFPEGFTPQLVLLSLTSSVVDRMHSSVIPWMNRVLLNGTRTAMVMSVTESAKINKQMLDPFQTVLLNMSPVTRRVVIAIGQIIYGELNPSGRLPMNWKVNQSLIGTRLPTSNSNNSNGRRVGPDVQSSLMDTLYTEPKDLQEYTDYFLGFNPPPQQLETTLFPFAHGYSFSYFWFYNMTIRPYPLEGFKRNDTFTLRFTVKNKAEISGKLPLIVFAGKLEPEPKDVHIISMTKLNEIGYGEKRDITLRVPVKWFLPHQLSRVNDENGNNAVDSNGNGELRQKKKFIVRVGDIFQTFDIIN